MGGAHTHARARGQRGDETLVVGARLTAAHSDSLDELVTLQGKSTPPIYYSPESPAGTLIIFKSDVAAMGEHTPPPNCVRVRVAFLMMVLV